jgi:hypothetical protein
MAKEACPKCGSLYEVIMHQAPMPDEDSFNCEVCGTELRKWKSNRWPEFKLIKPGKKPAND